ncbi:MAG: DUF1549 domain-containing protein [Gemmataceae bacterium]
MSLKLALPAFFLLIPCGASAGDKPLRQVIDEEIDAVWKKEKITPAGPAADTVFLRRIYLDLLGVVPSFDETTRFLNDTDPEKRAKLVDKLLDDPRYADEQSHVWDLVLFGRHPEGYEATRKREDFKNWLKEQFAKNEPYDRLVRNLLMGEQEGTELYYVQFRNQPEEATVAVTRVFLGTQLQCARCHDHPFENWTQKDFFGMTGFFVRLVVLDPVAGKGKGKGHYRIAEKSTGEVLFSGSVKETRPGKKGDPVPAKFLGGDLLAEPAPAKGFKEPDFKGSGPLPKPAFSRKEKLVDWLTAADNPYFARAVANRVWAQFMGRGLVHPVDDLKDKTPASHPALMRALTDYLVHNKFNLKWYIREVVNSKTYQLGDTGAVTVALPEKFERARIRPLSAEELMAALKAATASDDKVWKDNAGVEYMTRYFGEPVDGQGSFQGSLAEHLFLNNASHIRQLVQPRKGNLAETLLKSKESWEEKVDRMFLSILSRPPTPREKERFVKHLSGDSKMAPALLEEALWTLVSCSEFRFNR